MIYRISAGGIVHDKIHVIYNVLADYNNYTKFFDYIKSVTNIKKDCARMVIGYFSLTLQYDCAIWFYPYSKIEVNGINYDNGDFSYVYGLWELSSIDDNSTMVSYKLHCGLHSKTKHLLMCGIAKLHEYEAKHKFCERLSELLSRCRDKYDYF